jgi:hypothetical protein
MTLILLEDGNWLSTFTGELLGASPDALLILVGVILVLLCVVGGVEGKFKIDQPWRGAGLSLGVVFLVAGLLMHTLGHSPAKTNQSVISSAGASSGPADPEDASPSATPPGTPCGKVSARNHRIRGKYAALAQYKALAVTKSQCRSGLAGGKPNQQAADQAAISFCEAWAKKGNDPGECAVVMRGDTQVADW